MIFVKHDFYKNFLRSFNSGDINLSLDIFRSEITDLLTQKTDDFFSLLHKVNIKHKKNQSYEELLDIVIREIKTNEKFVRGLAFIIGQNNNVIKKNPKLSWIKLLDGIKRGIEQIATYFENNPRQEVLFKKKSMDMVQLKSSVVVDDTRALVKKDYTLHWIIGVTIIGVAGYLVYRHFQKIEESRLRIESLNLTETPKMELGGDLGVAVPPVVGSQELPIQQMNNAAPVKNDFSNRPEYNVTTDVLIPEMPSANQTMNQNIIQNPNNNIGNPNNQMSGQGTVNINVQPMSTPMQNQSLNQNNVNSVQQNNVNI